MSRPLLKLRQDAPRPVAAAPAPTPAPKPETQEQAKAERHARVNALLDLLALNHPEVFALPTVPLAIGINHRIRETYPDATRRTVGKALAVWTNSSQYLLACKPGAARMGLDGQPEGVVSQEQADHAAATLRLRGKQ